MESILEVLYYSNFYFSVAFINDSKRKRKKRKKEIIQLSDSFWT